MVFQDYALFPHMTVSENISFALVLKKLNKNTIVKRQNEIMNFFTDPRNMVIDIQINYQGRTKTKSSFGRGISTKSCITIA